MELSHLVRKSAFILGTLCSLQFSTPLSYAQAPPFYSKESIEQQLEISPIYQSNSYPKVWQDVRSDLNYELENYMLNKNDEFKNYEQTLSGIKNSDGKVRFTFDEISFLYDHGVSLEYLLEFANVEKARDEVFNVSQIHYFHKLNSSLNYPKTIYEFKDYLETIPKIKSKNEYIIHFTQSGFNKEDFIFENTPKPDALLFFPMDDDDGAFWNFWTNLRYNKVANNYDILVRFGNKDSDYFSAREELRSKGGKAELIMIMGHGSKKSIHLGTDNEHLWTQEYEDLFNSALEKFSSESNSVIEPLVHISDEYKALKNSYYLDLSDRNEFMKDMMHDGPNTTYFLFSCLTCEGGINDSNNFGNMLSSIANNGQRIIGSRVSFRGPDINITQVYPFNVNL